MFAKSLITELYFSRVYGGNEKLEVSSPQGMLHLAIFRAACPATFQFTINETSCLTEAVAPCSVACNLCKMNDERKRLGDKLRESLRGKRR